MTPHTAPTGGNDALRAARLKRGWRSQEAAAKGVSAAGREALDDMHFEVAPRTWRRWESAKPGWPRDDYAFALHAAFDRWPEDLGFEVPEGWQREEPPPDEDDVRRRTFVSVTAAALTVGPTPPRHVDPALITYFQEQLEGHYRVDMLLGPHDLIGTVSAQYELIDRLIRVAKGETRRGLLRVGAAYTALVGWLYQDAGDMGAAAFWRGLTQEIALRSRNPHLVAYSLVNQAQVRTDLRDGNGVVDLCEAALEKQRVLAPKVRVMVLQQQAHGASLTRDRGSVDTLIDQATGLLRHVEDDLPWGNACRRTPNYLEVQRATCYGRLGLGREANSLWEQLLSEVPGTVRRDRGVYLARQATAAATAQEPDQAVEIAREAAQIAVDTGSVRMRRELDTLQGAMRPWHDAPIGQELAEVLTAVDERG
ncbi:Twin-arginine translocation pathway signal [Streptomyces sp. RK75]|uniref:Twin-arginine translocation pathway signal n=1 Tax=Streptomyces sp. RK75 TaxID=2824895 RepID=UPI001B374E88|nr:Twin-arginine translocation pathway signal [Streptomyces sp. RK75]MBQ0864604.1 Twin-arginine translocation pathway signal [Streptomyces sp. RK75]